MTTAKTRRSGATAGSRERTRQQAAGKASEAFPVLIRLPRLTPETEPDATCRTEEEQAEIRPTIPMPVRTQDPESLSPAPLDSGNAVVSPPSAGPQGNALWNPTLAARNSRWLRFGFPRWAARAVIATGLIVVLGLAFSAIWNPAKDNDVDRVADIPAADVLALPGLPAAPTPLIPLSAPSPASSAPATTNQPSSPASTGVPTADSPPAAVVANSPPRPASDERPPTALTSADSPVAAPGAQDGGPAFSPASAPEPTAQQIAAASRQSAAALTAASHPRAGEANAPAAPPDNEAAWPLTGMPTAGSMPSAANQYTYPETDPATFQYPPDYHLRLRGRGAPPTPPFRETGGGGPRFNGPATNATMAGGGQPSTARLQPPIEPPPVR